MSTSDRLRPGPARATKRAIWDELSRHQRKVLLLGRDQWAVVLVIVLVTVQVGLTSAYPLALLGAVDAMFAGQVARAVWLAMVVFGTLVAWNLTAWLHRELAARVGHGMLERLQMRVYSHLQALPLDYFTETKSGEIQAKLTENFTLSRFQLVEGTTGWLYTGGAAVGGIVILGVLDWRFVVAAIPVVVAVVWLVRVNSRTRASIERELRDAAKELSNVAGESISPRVVIVNKTIGGHMQHQRFGRYTSLVTELATKLDVRLQVLQAPVNLAFASMLASVVVFVALSAADGEPVLTPGGLVAVTGALSVALYNFQEFVPHQLRITGLIGRFKEAYEILEIPVQTRSGRRALPPETPGHLTFRNVSFRYTPDDERALANVTFDVRPGEHVAIVGRSGAGKSTLTKCAVGLLDPTEGRVLIDGVDLRDLDERSLQRTVGLVSQDAILTHDTVRENILWGRDATDEELHEAARLAQIHDDITALRHRYDTIVGSEGTSFSGGERQRLHIVRVALGRPKVLILDEATSALDPVMQSAVDEALRELQQGRTTVTIAHRSSTVRSADRILVFDAGRLVESGTHDELMMQGGHYASQVVATLGTG